MKSCSPLGGRIDLGGADRAEELRDDGRTRAGRARRTRKRDQLGRGPHPARELGDRLEGREHVGPQARAQDGGAGGGSCELVEQPRLAHPGRGDDRDPGGRAEERTKVLDLDVAPERRRPQPAERALPRPFGMDTDGPPSRNRLGLPLELEQRQALQFDRVRDRERGGLADRHGLGLSRRL